MGNSDGPQRQAGLLGCRQDSVRIRRRSAGPPFDLSDRTFERCVELMAFWRSKKTTESDLREAATEAQSSEGDSSETVAPRPEIQPPSAQLRGNPATCGLSARSVLPRRRRSDTGEQGKPASGGLFAKMRGALSKTRQALNTDIRDLFKSEGRLVDDEFLGSSLRG